MKFMTNDDLAMCYDLSRFNRIYQKNPNTLKNIMKYNELIDLVGHDLLKHVSESERINITSVYSIYTYVITEILETNNKIDTDYYIVIIEDLIMRERINNYMSYGGTKNSDILEDLCGLIDKYPDSQLFVKLNERYTFDFSFM